MIVSCGSRSTVWSHQPRAFSLNPQPESLLAVVHESVGCCVFLALDRTVLTRGAGKKTGSYSSWSSWSWREGARTCPRDPPVTGQPWQDGKQQECWPGSLSAGLGATVPFLLGFAKSGSVSQPLTPFPPSSAPPASSLACVVLQREASSGSNHCRMALLEFRGLWGMFAGIASLIVNTMMEKRALGIQVSWTPAKPSSSHSIAGNSHPGKSMPGVTFTGLNNLVIFVFV